MKKPLGSSSAVADQSHNPVAAPRVRITTAIEAAARDALTIAAGTLSFDLMWAAGTAAANEILARWPEHLSSGVAVYAGTGNNGGDAYVVATHLARAGVTVRLRATAPPRTPDAIRASIIAAPLINRDAPRGDERLVIDGILGTGQRGELSGVVRDACIEIATAHERSGIVVALDVPTGVDATTGTVATHAVHATATFTFGTLKRAHVIARETVGDIVVLDIGLVAAAGDDVSWRLADEHTLSLCVPPIAWNAHKGTKGRVAIVGGAVGMAGAVTLAARAAAASGVGLVHASVAHESVLPVQIGAIHAVAHAWPSLPEQWSEAVASSSAIAIGPGLGRSSESPRVLEQLLRAPSSVPVVLDADALTLFASSPDVAVRIRHSLNGRAAVLTPHPGEFARLVGIANVEALGDLANRAKLASEFAVQSGATVLLKGAPTVVASPTGEPPTVVARGTAVLATGGSGDMLTGIIATLLAQGATAHDAAVIGAWVHGVSAEIATRDAQTVRGVTLEHVIAAMPRAWHQLQFPVRRSAHVLAELPSPLVAA